LKRLESPQFEHGHSLQIGHRAPHSVLRKQARRSTPAAGAFLFVERPL